MRKAKMLRHGDRAAIFGYAFAVHYLQSDRASVLTPEVP
jgi:hypothetical protein